MKGDELSVLAPSAVQADGLHLTNSQEVIGLPIIFKTTSLFPYTHVQGSSTSQRVSSVDTDFQQVKHHVRPARRRSNGFHLRPGQGEQVTGKVFKFSCRPQLG